MITPGTAKPISEHTCLSASLDHARDAIKIAPGGCVASLPQCAHQRIRSATLWLPLSLRCLLTYDNHNTVVQYTVVTNVEAKWTMLIPPTIAVPLTTAVLTAAPAAIASVRLCQHPVINRLLCQLNPWFGVSLIVVAGIAFLVLMSSASNSRAVGNNTPMQQQQQQVSAGIDRGGSKQKQAPHVLRIEKAVQVEAKQLTIVEYLKKYNPGQFEYLPDNPSFTSEELWLDFQEARHNMVPQFRSDGTRIYHPALLGWCLDIEHSAENC